jgi:hypothetical protein
LNTLEMRSPNNGNMIFSIDSGKTKCVPCS